MSPFKFVIIATVVLMAVIFCLNLDHYRESAYGLRDNAHTAVETAPKASWANNAAPTKANGWSAEQIKDDLPGFLASN